MPAPFVIFSPDWRILDCNQAFASLTGFSRDEVKSSSPFLYGVKPSGAENIELIGTGPCTGEQLKFLTHVLVKNGTIIPVSAYLSEVKDNKGDITGYYAVIGPVETKCELPASNLLGCIGDPVLLIDKKTDVLFANNEAVAVLKKDTSDIIGKKIMDLYRRPSYTLFYKKLMYSIDERRASGLEDFDIRLNRWYDIRFYPCGEDTIIHFRDINLRKHQDWWLRMAMFSLDKIREPVLIVDAIGRILYINASALDVLGYEKDEMRALKIFDFIRPIPAERWEDIMVRARSVKRVEINASLACKGGKAIAAKVDAYYLKFFNVEYLCLVVKTAAGD